MALKPIRQAGPRGHPEQKPGTTAEDVRVKAAIFPRAFEEGRALGGKAVDKPEDLRGHSLSQEHEMATRRMRARQEPRSRPR